MGFYAFQQARLSGEAFADGSAQRSFQKSGAEARLADLAEGDGRTKRKTKPRADRPLKGGHAVAQSEDKSAGRAKGTATWVEKIEATGLTPDQITGAARPSVIKSIYATAKARSKKGGDFDRILKITLRDSSVSSTSVPAGTCASAKAADRLDRMFIDALHYLHGRAEMGDIKDKVSRLTLR